ncbi:MAG: hypothetical protein D6791_09355, partial [Chloroflexi bacterium]
PACREGDPNLKRFVRPILFILFIAALAVIPFTALAQGGSQPPNLNISGEVTFVAGSSPVKVAPALTLTGPAGGTLDKATVVLGDGFKAGEDRLGIAGQSGASGTVNGLAWSYDESSGILTLSNSGSFTDYQAALRQVVYSNVGTTPTGGDRGVTIAVGSSLFYEGNGHYYEFVSAPKISWTDAKAAAEGRSYYGLQGYLVTVTSQGENDFVAGKLQGRGWMGASDAGHDKRWFWVTGPEADTWFFTQNGYNPNGANSCGKGPAAQQPGDFYTNWAPEEPNDYRDGCADNENYGHFFENGTWNDYPVSSGLIAGYVVEYGGMPGDPTLSLSGQVTIHVVAGNSACEPYVSEAGDYSLVYHLEIPTTADYNNDPVPYATDRSSEIGAYDRVAYCTLLDDKWVWVSMDDFTGGEVAKTGVPVASVNPDGFQQRVDNMFVASNVSGVVTGPNIATGNIEFWNNCYGPQIALGLPGASSSAFDFDDSKDTSRPRCYGSMQVHNYGAGQTVFAFNRWDEGGGRINDVGIGNSTGQHPDWTFAGNATDYANRQLWVLVRESTIDDDLILHWDFEEGPGNCTVQDKSGNNHTGTLTNMDCTTAWSTDVPDNSGQTYAMHLEGVGSGDYVTSAPSALFPSGNAPRSLCTWVKSDDGVVDTHADHIVNYGQAITDKAFGLMMYTRNTHHWQGYFHDNDLDTGIRADTQWHHHCLVHNGSFVTYYMDGEVVKSGWTTAVNTPPNTPLIVGARPDLASSTHFDGLVDDVRLYGRALSADEVKELYHGRRPAVAPPAFFRWQNTIVDTQGGGFTSMANINGRPAISYYGYYGGRDLRYARFDGSSWQITTVDAQGDVGISTSLKEVNGQPAISYYHRGNADLKYARYDGNEWRITTVDTHGGNQGYTSLAVVDGQPAISYHDVSNGDLKYARFDGSSWQITTVDAQGDVGWWSSLAVVNGQPAISYYDWTNGDLKYARFDGTSWQITAVDAQGDVGWSAFLAVVLGQPAISYYDSTNGDLKYARLEGASWKIVTVDAEGDVGGDSSLAVVNGQPAFSYYNKTTVHLKYAWGEIPVPPADGNGDGIPDSQQPNVATVPGAAGFLTLAAPEGVTLQDVEAAQPPEAPPANVEVPQGLVGFQATGISAGGSFSMTLTVQDGPIATSYWKFGSTPDNSANHWYEFTYDPATGTGAEIKGRQIILHYVDGKRGDNDLTANGVIGDPGGPAGVTLRSFIYLPTIR